MLKKLCEVLQSVYDTDGDKDDFSDLQKAYGLLLSVSNIDGTHVPEQVRMLPLVLTLSRTSLHKDLFLFLFDINKNCSTLLVPPMHPQLNILLLLRDRWMTLNVDCTFPSN